MFEIKKIDNVRYELKIQKNEMIQGVICTKVELNELLMDLREVFKF